ncbi:OmpA family protein [Nonomuraea rhodomycinica]|uniref:OmpA family protein n=1 Tax=Nonomuraea rhodomycinica TaxID=1712872 RepID=A0A7Y6IQC8_9ACTN|nr:OmpA family protein [Nonomuraea rhodomycinica]NUW41154.1 OmpA family protein [Nonomuraea rhodomycinica]
MSRFLSVASLGVAAGLLLPATPLFSSPTVPPVPSDAYAPVEDLVLPVEDVIGEVESLDGAQSETKQGTQVTVALTSDVLFALDRWTLTGAARKRLQGVAEQVKAEGAGGVVKVQGHTDDQGSDAYNLRLSQRRAQAVEQALRGLLAGADVTLQAQGYGESRPKLPNIVEGKPVEGNRARNRRVEIVFDARQ